VLVRTAWISDDGLISLRTVLNVNHGNGLTFNFGEARAEFTHPLWLPLLTAELPLIRNVYYATFALAIGGFPHGVLAGHLGGRRPRGSVDSRGRPAFVGSIHGLLDVGAREPPRQPAADRVPGGGGAHARYGRRWTGRSGGLASLVYLARPDTVLIVAPMLLAATYQARREPGVARAVALGLLPGGHGRRSRLSTTAFRSRTPRNAKLGMDVRQDPTVEAGRHLLHRRFDRDPLTPVLILSHSWWPGPRGPG